MISPQEPLDIAVLKLSVISHELPQQMELPISHGIVTIQISIYYLKAGTRALLEPRHVGHERWAPILQLNAMNKLTYKL